jgi:hypothetical protein
LQALDVLLVYRAYRHGDADALAVLAEQHGNRVCPDFG